METVNLIFSADKKYAPFLGVVLCSIFESKRSQNQIVVYILDGGILPKDKEKLEILIKKYSAQINFIKMDTSLFKDFFISEYISQASYYRIMIPKVLPALEKVLYLDCDLIVLSDIFELYKTDISNYFLAAIPEPLTNRQEELGMPQTAPYFNAGIMLLNLDKWRETKITEKLIAFIQENPTRLRFWDQDALNAILWDKWFPLSLKYNYMTSTIETNPIPVEKIKEHVAIIHFSSKLKPWNYLCNHPLKEIYFNYLAKTPWQNEKFADKNLKKILIKFLCDTIIYLFPNSWVIKIRKFKQTLGIKFY